MGQRRFKAVGFFDFYPKRLFKASVINGFNHEGGKLKAFGLCVNFNHSLSIEYQKTLKKDGKCLYSEGL